MDQFDEYQKSLQYKNGFYAFFLLIILLALSMILEIQWAESTFYEIFIIIAISISFFHMRNAWQGAYLALKERAAVANSLSILSGILVLIPTFNWDVNPFQDYLADGKLGATTFSYILALASFSRPVFYGINIVREKLKDRE